MAWTYTVPNVDQLIGAFDGKLFVRLLSGGFSAIDLESGKTLLTEHGMQPRRLLPNAQTDRLYLVGKTGAVQCLRPIGSKLPVFNEMIKGVPTDKQSETVADETEEPVGPTPVFGDQKADADPFGGGGGGDDPFGGGGDPFGGGDDAMADPFGGGGDAAGGDPFADPFGN